MTCTADKLREALNAPPEATPESADCAELLMKLDQIKAPVTVWLSPDSSVVVRG